ncbi:hypothetical protein [Elizabethkingia anophelis]|uniref:hypothetical protein n=1 Tax=Elizabethkingia anophelis TaxID=1117645 RepID=UPI0024E1F52D|nr:hypothetical protein [Elizabethkingia anophelis]CAH1139816.1 hypothetical protein EAVNVB490_01003 [Elizabethkingia anophelis]CAI9669833.1 hypothetical protein EAVNNN508_01003 [Elizabethkingia anophelis]CAI9676390.1 hypothetical protein EAVNVB490_03803 [Elizabethkingia anophelis]CAI9687690.1 hypothetical protein EAVNNN508_03801 [Elizabethkingia anophelis]
MNRKLLYTLVWGFLLMLLFNGCRTNDEAIKNERQIQGAEYSSKTLWNEDEKYIKNVIKIYNQNKETVSKSTQIKGEPFWDYAMTMGQFNESYLEVPVVNQEKVVQILRVIRKGSQVYFGSNSEEKASLDFFQQLIFGKYTKIKTEEERKGKVNSGGGATAYGEVVCTTRKISMWYPDNNNNPDGSGHWESKYETKCEWVEKEKVDTIDPCVGPECVGGGGLPEGGNPGFPYPDEAAEINIDQLKPYPCAYALAQELPNLNNELATVLNKIFKNSDKYKITFRGKANMGKDDGKGGGAFNEYGKFNATIDLNEDVLQNASKEYILVTMYHEVIHAYLDFEEGRLGAQRFSEAYPMFWFSYDKDSSGNPVKRIYFLDEHQEYGQFLDTLENIISSYNTQHSPNNPLSRETIRAMAKSGVTQTTQNEFELNEKERGTNSTKHGAPNGTKCP